MKANSGFTLIEVIIFVVVLGVVATGLLMSFGASLEASPEIQKNSIAVELAEQRMDLILGQRHGYGFASTADPCTAAPSLPACQVPAGYTVSSSIANNWDGDTDYKVVTVTVSGSGTAQVQSLVANYS
ncbi:MAG: hypothetical protein A2298_04505 [Gammaproteobacteria bacterium RIFOXYB2_FULL_38_6]|nr:MAG: hypothetical protein A2298_04505 [Gammaproteobacteria bacterium RIFOXYB2_FULL_38_6]